MPNFEIEGFVRVSRVRRLPENGVMEIVLEIADSEMVAFTLTGRPNGENWYFVGLQRATSFEVANFEKMNLAAKIMQDPMGAKTGGKTEIKEGEGA